VTEARPDGFDERLIESIARALHELWVERKKSAGWIYALISSDERRTHCDLVQWERLANADGLLWDVRMKIQILLEIGYEVVPQKAGKSAEFATNSNGARMPD